MGPVAEAEGHDAPRLIDEIVPRCAGVIEDVFVSLEDLVG